MPCFRRLALTLPSCLAFPCLVTCRQLRQIGPGMVQQIQTTCPACRGAGKTMSEKDKCKECRGRKVRFAIQFYPTFSQSVSRIPFAGSTKRLIPLPLGLRPLKRHGYFFVSPPLWFQHELIHMWWIAAHRW
jgi:hypothetical protein